MRILNQKISRILEEKRTTQSQRDIREEGQCKEEWRKGGKENVDLRNVHQLIVVEGGGERDHVGGEGGGDHIAHIRPCETRLKEKLD